MKATTTRGRDRVRPQNVPRGKSSRIDVVIWWTSATTTLLASVVVSVAGHDAFRAPKEYVLRAGGIVILGALIIRVIWRPRDTSNLVVRHKRATILALVVVAWTAVTTLLSTNVWLSRWSLLYVAVCAVFFLGTLIAAQERSLNAVYVVLSAGTVNAVVLLLQEARVWDPFWPLEEVSRRSAFVGNPNDVGAHLLTPALAALALTATSPRRRRPHAMLAAVIVIGLFASQSATAIGAFLTSAVAMTLIRFPWRRALVAVVLAVVLVAAGFAAYAPLRTRVKTVRSAVQNRDYNLLSSYRLTSIMVASRMFLDYPITGIGPGSYAWHYFPYKVAAEVRHPLLRQSGERMFMYGEAHSDHLQILAVSGLPGYLIFLACWVYLARISFYRPNEPSNTMRFTRICALPLAAGVFVLMIAQFPLELAASTTPILFCSALCVAWEPKRTDEVS